MTNPRLSVVVPVYRAQETVELLVQRIEEATSSIGGETEIVLVDDASPDESWAEIVRLCATRPNVRGVKLSRNFGQHRAISAGLTFAKGDWVAVMDCDLQDNPSYLPAFLKKAEEGFDVVLSRRSARQHPPIKNFFARLFATLFNSLIDDGTAKMSGFVGAYSLLSRKVVDAFNRMREYHRHYLPLVRLLGFSQGWIDVEHEPRTSGRSTYTFGKLVKHAMEGLTAHSVKLLYLSIAAGLGFVLFSLVGAAYYVVGYLRHGALPGFTSIIVMIMLSTGMIMLSTGIVGIYVGRIFEQVKERPLFIVDTVLNP